jgi:hypothetical protein
VEGFDPERGRHGGLEEESTDNIVGGTDSSFSFAVLLRCVRTGEAKEGAMLSEEGVNLFVIKFAAIVTLNSEYRKIELSTSIGMKGSESNKNIGFLSEGKRPKIMCIIVYNDKIITKTRGTRGG